MSRLARPALFAVAALGLVSLLLQQPPRAGTLPPARAAASGAPAAAVLLFDQPLDLNVATAADLAALPGLGPVRAARIVELRDERRGFRAVDELLDVRGIGPATLARVREHLKVSP
jgi:competence protein ComEA